MRPRAWQRPPARVGCAPGSWDLTAHWDPAAHQAGPSPEPGCPENPEHRDSARDPTRAHGHQLPGGSPSRSCSAYRLGCTARPTDQAHLLTAAPHGSDSPALRAAAAPAPTPHRANRPTPSHKVRVLRARRSPSILSEPYRKHAHAPGGPENTVSNLH